jgi:hypothetical protein
MRLGGAALAALLLATPSAAQLGTATQSPPPEGVAEGEGAAFPKGDYAALDALPDWGGIWFVMFGASNNQSTAAPQPKGEYAELRAQWLAAARANDGVVPRARSNCSPPGMPRIMRLAQYPYEFIFSPGRVTINQEAWMQTRTIWTDGRAHDPDHDPSFMGDSIGHWEGDSLVVETVGILDTLEIDTGFAHSDKFRLVERIHLDPADPNVLGSTWASDFITGPLAAASMALAREPVRSWPTRFRPSAFASPASLWLCSSIALRVLRPW